VRAGTALGQEAEDYMNSGGLVPDYLIIALVTEEIKNATLNEEGNLHVLLDGFPRTAAQARALDAAGVDVSMALDLKVPYEDIVKRASMRWIHPTSGRVYAYDYNPPKVRCFCILYKR
jgi:adenylate kinase